MRKRTFVRKRFLLPMLTAAALAAGSGLGTVPAARAAGYVYQQHVVNAGVLVNGSDPAPYLFYVLNNRPDVRQPDLTFINPLAPSGADPKTAAYWEVSLNNVSDSELAQYDVLYLRADGITFPPAVNEKLRRFVDNGGQLIVEYGGAAKPIGLFTGTGVTVLTPPAMPTAVTFPAAGAAALLQPIVSQPYLLSGTDLTSFGTPSLYLSPNAADPVHAAEFTSLLSPALVDTTGPVVSAVQIGAGQVVASTLNIGAGISVGSAAAFVQTDLYKASTTDLKLLANIIAWSETHPNENKTSHGDASNTGLASFSPAWQYPVASGTAGTLTPSGAAVWGNFVFAVDATGVLRAFDAYPAENLTGGSTTDDGVTDYSAGTSYDEIWDTGVSPAVTVGANASAPMVAAFKGVNYVFVEKSDGSVVCLNAITRAAAPFDNSASTLPPPASGGTFTGGNAPSPTFYDGRLYAGQANGTLHVYDLNEGTSAVVPLEANPPLAGATEFVTGSPAVGTLANGDTNVLVAVVPTNFNIYTVLLGARNEPLKPYMLNGATVGYSINRLGRYDLNNIFADVNAVPALQAYDYSGNSQGVSANSTAPNPQDPLFAITGTLGYYTDWDMDFNAATGAGSGATTPTPVNLNYISADSAGELNSGTPTAAVMSAPAVDRHGDYYYTETNGANSYLIGVTNALLRNSVHLKFRFLIPTGTLTDADSVTYDNSNIVGLHFVGAPVVDDQGNVYAAATNGTAATPATKATVLCFRGNQQVSAIPYPTPANPPATPPDLSEDTITQTDEVSGDNTIQRGPDTNVGAANAAYGQFIASPPPTTGNPGYAASSLTFYNFGHYGQTPTAIVGNLTEPQPLTATTNDGTAATIPLGMRTNLAWFVTPFPITGNVTGLSLVGTSVFLTDGASLYRLSTKPQVGANKTVAALPSVTPLNATGSTLGAVGSAPSVGGSVMVINGTNGIAARTRQVTVIADNNRVLGVDGDGGAVWAVDATTRTDLTATPPVATKVPFSHPTALSQFALNDYLVADTGNNRCVRFDSGGNVQWELTRFQDPSGLLASGQPMTLSQPSSIVTRPAFILPATDPLYPGGIATPYLVADSGNDRIVEVSDIVDTSGNLHSHVLTWTSHTADKDGRHYRYGSAVYYPNTATASGYSIAATVVNTRIGTLAAAGGLGPVSGAAPGGSIAVFNYDATGEPAYTTAGFYAATASGGYTPLTIRNPRFLQLYTPPTTATAVATGIAPFDFLYADDNGAFDLTYSAGGSTVPKGFIAGADRLQFTTANYQSMPTVPYGVPNYTVDSSGNKTLLSTYSRTGLPFIPTCVEALSSDSQTSGGTTTTTRRYLITQNSSQGELGTSASTTTGTGASAVTTTIGKIGGEIFEVDVTNPPPAVAPPATANSVTTPGGFGNGQTLSHPDLTGPLTQPTYGVRLP